MSHINTNLLEVIREIHFAFLWTNTVNKGMFYSGDNDFNNNKDTMALRFCVEVSGENYGYERDGNTYHEEWQKSYTKYLHILVTSGHNVYVAESDLRVVPDVALFNNVSNHSDCWFADGIEASVNEMVRVADATINDHVPEEHRHNRVSIRLEDNPNIFSFCKITYEHTGNGWRKLTGIKCMNFNFTLKEAE